MKGIARLPRCLLPVSLLLAPAPVTAQAGEIAEFRERQVPRFDSAGHRKANGLEISLAYPRGWRAGEGDRPHVVQTFVATGEPLICNLLVRDAGEAVSEAQARAFLRPASIQERPVRRRRPVLRAAERPGPDLDPVAALRASRRPHARRRHARRPPESRRGLGPRAARRLGAGQ